MEGEDDDSDNSNEEEDGSDENQANVNRNVAEMLQNQKQYIQLCSSSAQLLQLLSRFVPGSAISAQMMKMEGATDESEESTAESESASSACSPATSDNSGCVLWAEPIMTCQLVPNLKPYCDDVRRLPPGVRPEDLKSKNQPGNGSGASFDNELPPNGARNRFYPGKGKDGLTKQSNAQTISGFKDTCTQTPRKDGGSNPPTGVGQRSENVGFVNIDVTHAVLNDAISKISNAADTIKRARNILAAVSTNHQANNNNSPEGAGDGGSLESGATISENSSSDKDVDPGRHGEARTELNTAVEDACRGDFQDNQSRSQTNFPTPILVKAAEHVQSDITEAVPDTTKEMTTPSGGVTQSSLHSDQGICLCFDKSSYTDGLSKQSSTSRKIHLQSGHIKTSTPTICDSRMIATEFKPPRLLRHPRVNGQLYRYPTNTATSQSNNRTQQSLSLETMQTENRIPPPLESLPVLTQSTKPRIYEKLVLDLSAVGISQNTRQWKKKHRITYSYFKNALETVMNNLQTQSALANNGKCMKHDGSPPTQSSASTFTRTEIESLNIPPGHSERDSLGSEAADATYSDIIVEATNVGDSNTGGDGTASTGDLNGGDGTASIGDLATEVEAIFYIEHRSPNESSMEAEATDNQEGYSGSEREAKHGVISSSPRKTGILTCTIYHSSDSEESSQVPETSPRISSSHSQLCSGPSLEKECQNKPNSNSTYTTFGLINTESDRFTDILKAEPVTCHAEEQEESIRKKTLKELATVISQSANLNIMNEVNRTAVRHLYRVRPNEETGPSYSRRKIKSQVRNAKSIGKAFSAQEVKGRLESQRPTKDGNKKIQEGDNLTNVVIVSKGGVHSPPAFPEAGDTVENVTKNDSLVGRNDQIDIRNKIQNHPTNSHAASNESSRRNCGSKLVKRTGSARRKRGCTSEENPAWPCVERGQVDMHIGKSNNASLGNESNRSHPTSERDKIIDGSLMQSGKCKLQTIDMAKVVDIHDQVVEISISQDEQSQVMIVGKDNCHNQHDLIRLQSSMNDEFNKGQSYGQELTDKLLDSSASIVGHSVGIPSSFENVLDTNRSKDDLSISEKSVNSRCVSLETSLRTRSGKRCTQSSERISKKRCRGNKVELLKCSMNKEGPESVDSDKPSNSLRLISNNQITCHDFLPRILPEDNVHPELCMKSNLVLPNLRDTPTPTVECSTVIWDLSEKHSSDNHVAAPGSSSAKGDSSMSFPCDAVDFPREVDSTQTRALLPLETAPRATQLEDEDGQQAQNGIKVRLRRFFARCLHPFGRKD